MILVADNLTDIKQTLPPKIKRIKPIPLQKENQLSAFLKSRGCNREELSLQFCLRMTSQIDLFRSSYRGKQWAQFFEKWLSLTRC